MRIIIIDRITAVAIVVIATWLAPNPKPIAIARKRKPNSSGSLIAALNLTIDNAPTKPSDNAKEDFTIVMTNIVVMEISTKFLLNCLRFDNELPYFEYTHPTTKESRAAIMMFIKNS